MRILKKAITHLCNLLLALKWFFADVYEMMIRYVPGRLGPWHIGYHLSANSWRKRCKSFGDNTLIYENVRLYFPFNISIGSNVSITDDCILSAGSEPEGGKIILSDDIFISPGTRIYASDHDYNVKNINRDARYKFAPVILEGNNWLAAKVGVLPEVTVGMGSVAAMGAVVTKDVPAGTLVSGVPAKVMKKIQR